MANEWVAQGERAAEALRSAGTESTGEVLTKVSPILQPRAANGARFLGGFLARLATLPTPWPQEADKITAALSASLATLSGGSFSQAETATLAAHLSEIISVFNGLNEEDDGVLVNMGDSDSSLPLAALLAASAAVAPPREQGKFADLPDGFDANESLPPTLVYAKDPFASLLDSNDMMPPSTIMVDHAGSSDNSEGVLGVRSLMGSQIAEPRPTELFFAMEDSSVTLAPRSQPVQNLLSSPFASYILPAVPAPTLINASVMERLSIQDDAAQENGVEQTGFKQDSAVEKLNDVADENVVEDKVVKLNAVDAENVEQNAVDEKVVEQNVVQEESAHPSEETTVPPVQQNSALLEEFARPVVVEYPPAQFVATPVAPYKSPFDSMLPFTPLEPASTDRILATPTITESEENAKLPNPTNVNLTDLQPYPSVQPYPSLPLPALLTQAEPDDHASVAAVESVAADTDTDVPTGTIVDAYANFDTSALEHILTQPSSVRNDVTASSVLPSMDSFDALGAPALPVPTRHRSLNPFDDLEDSAPPALPTRPVESPSQPAVTSQRLPSSGFVQLEELDGDISLDVAPPQPAQQSSSPTQPAPVSATGTQQPPAAAIAPRWMPAAHTANNFLSPNERQEQTREQEEAEGVRRQQTYLEIERERQQELIKRLQAQAQAQAAMFPTSILNSLPAAQQQAAPHVTPVAVLPTHLQQQQQPPRPLGQPFQQTASPQSTVPPYQPTAPPPRQQPPYQQPAYQQFGQQPQQPQQQPQWNPPAARSPWNAPSNEPMLVVDDPELQAEIAGNMSAFAQQQRDMLAQFERQRSGNLQLPSARPTSTSEDELPLQRGLSVPLSAEQRTIQRARQNYPRQLAELCSMGFEESKCAQAIVNREGDLEQATDDLLTGE